MKNKVWHAKDCKSKIEWRKSNVLSFVLLRQLLSDWILLQVALSLMSKSVK